MENRLYKGGKKTEKLQRENNNKNRKTKFR